MEHFISRKSDVGNNPVPVKASVYSEEIWPWIRSIWIHKSRQWWAESAACRMWWNTVKWGAKTIEAAETEVGKVFFLLCRWLCQCIIMTGSFKAYEYFVRTSSFSRNESTCFFISYTTAGVSPAWIKIFFSRPCSLQRSQVITNISIPLERVVKVSYSCARAVYLIV